MFRTRARQQPHHAVHAFPRTDNIDSTAALLAEGYGFIPRRCAALQSDVFTTRLMLRKVVCVQGQEAARMFFQPGRFTRRHAIPLTTLTLLQDFGSAQLLDGAAHDHRKAMFMSLMTRVNMQHLMDISVRLWRERFAAWQRTFSSICLQAEAEAVLCRAACQWAGVPLAPGEAEKRTNEFAAMIEGAGSAGPRNWNGQLLRIRTERWARKLIDDVRGGRIDPPRASALAVIASHRDEKGSYLPRRTAAVELINILRPIVAAARYITFGAVALHEHPQFRAPLAQDDQDFAAMFVQEVRRYYPFFTAIGGRVLEAFDWRGHHFAPGAWVLLDIHGSHRDGRTWSAPDTFRPGRFAGWTSNGYDLIPQGGGDFTTGHRCAGEWITIGLVKTALQMLAGEVGYDVPPQDLRIDLTRMPAIPTSRFLISHVRAKH